MKREVLLASLAATIAAAPDSFKDRLAADLLAYADAFSLASAPTLASLLLEAVAIGLNAEASV